MLIGAVVGGVLGGLCLIGLVVALVVRSRRASQDVAPNRGDTYQNVELVRVPPPPESDGGTMYTTGSGSIKSAGSSNKAAADYGTIDLSPKATHSDYVTLKT